MLGSTNDILAKEMRGQIESRDENNNKPAGSMPSRTGREDEDRTCRSPKGVRLSSVHPTAMPADGEADAFDLGEGLDRDIECEAGEGSMFPCIA